jgi:glycosyltransferase involved in cell wall biosynthesis
MRVLDVVSSVNPAQGGPIEGVKQHARVARERGLEIEVATFDAWDAPHVAEFPGPVHALGPALGVRGLRDYRYAPKAAAWLALHAARYDAVIVHGLWQYQTLAVWRALRGTSVPYFVFPHGMLDPWFKRTYPAKHAKKWLYWRGQPARCRDARRVVHLEERVLARETFRPHEARTAVVASTAATDSDPAGQLHAFWRGSHVVGQARLAVLEPPTPQEGVRSSIAAFARVAHSDPQLQLVMAGPDQVGWQAELAARAAALGIGERIVWTGMLAGDAKWGAYRAAEAFVLPSHQENFGIVVAEALACSVPVLISDKVNIWREIAAAQAGLVRDDTAAGTAALLRDWLDTDGETRGRMRVNANRCFRQHFDLQTVISRLHDVLREVRPAFR